MKVWLLSNDPIFTRDIEWGFKQLNNEVQVGMPTTKESFHHMVSQIMPNLIITLGSPAWYKSIDVLNQLGERSSSCGYDYVHWDTDGISWAYDYELPLIYRTKPDYVFTVCTEMLALLKNQGIKTALLAYGYNPEIHYPDPGIETYGGMITYVGNAYTNILANPKHYRTKSVETLIGGAMQAGFRVDLWGDPKLKHFKERWQIKAFDESWYHGTCDYMDTKKIYTHSKFNLAPQNHPDYLTKRTFEIMGCGGSIITYDIPGLKNYFKKDEELIVAADKKELIEKINYYKKHEELLTAIRQKGFEAVKQHSYKERVRTLVKIMDQKE